MKILFTGSIQVGKSTLLDNFKDLNIPGVWCIPEVAREIIDRSPESFIVPGKSAPLPNMGDYIFNEQVRRETYAKQSGARVILCDRGSLDIIAHTVLFKGKIKSAWEIWARSYDHIFLFDREDVPFDASLLPPGRDWVAFREALDETTKMVLSQRSLKYEILSGTVHERSEAVLSIIAQNTSPEGQRIGLEIGKRPIGKERY